MKITNVKAVYPKWSHQPGKVWQKCFWQIVVRIDTDIGVIGYGYGGGGEPGVLVINKHLRHHLEGVEVNSVDDIRKIWDSLYLASLPYGRTGIALMAISGIDLALWDLLGHAEKKPVYDLIGIRTKKQIRAYASCSDFKLARDLGYNAVKFFHQWKGDSDYDEAVEMASHIRNLLPNALLMVDCYLSWDYAVTLEMSRCLSEFDIYWFEDVLSPDHLEELASLRPKIKPVLLAGGEHDFSPKTFQTIAQTGALDLWQPDITWCGGMTAGLRIMSLAKSHNIPVVLHRGGEVWGLHLIAVSDCMDLAETLLEHWTTPEKTLWLEEPRVKNGTICPLDLPGFGVHLNEDML